MPQSPKRKAEYQKEYNARPDVMARRVKANAARREAMRDGLVKKGDGKDVAHKKPLTGGGTNHESNVTIQDASENRGWRKGRSGYKVPTVRK